MVEAEARIVREIFDLKQDGLTLQAIADRLDVQLDPKRVSHGKLVEVIWEHQVGDHLHAPTFVRDFPVESSPLTRDHRSIRGQVE